jgi:hypothetical protein
MNEHRRLALAHLGTAACRTSLFTDAQVRQNVLSCIYFEASADYHIFMTGRGIRLADHNHHNLRSGLARLTPGYIRFDGYTGHFEST